METVVSEGYAEHVPPIDLAGYVLCFWTSLRPSSVNRPASARRVLPDGCVDIVLGFGRDDDPASAELTQAFGVGAMTKPLIVDGRGPRLYVGVRFKPGFAYAAFGIPAAELTDERVDFDLLGEGPSELADIELQTTDAGRLSATMSWCAAASSARESCRPCREACARRFIGSSTRAGICEWRRWRRRSASRANSWRSSSRCMSA